MYLSKFHLLIFILLIQQCLLGQQRQLAAEGIQPISGFVENKGQMTDTKGNPVNNVLFRTDGPGCTIWITTTGLTLHILQPVNHAPADSAKNSLQLRKWERIDLVLDQATILPHNIQSTDTLTESRDYYLPHCKGGITGVRSFGKIIIRNVYPGIDWVLYKTKNNSFKYDFIVSAQANYQDINMVYFSQQPVTVTKEGHLAFSTFAGQLYDSPPVSYSGQQQITTRFNVRSQHKITYCKEEAYVTSIGFAFPERNVNNLPLIIDPELVWGTYFGGSDDELPLKTNLDAAGNLFIVGETSSPDFPAMDPGNGSYFQGYSPVIELAFLSKFSNSGILLWSTFFGGSNGFASARDVELDGNGNIFVAGWTNTSSLPVMDPGNGAWYHPSEVGVTDIFLLRFAQNGQLTWSTYWGGSGFDTFSDMDIDPNGNMFICGQTQSTDIPQISSAGAFQQSSINSTNDSYIAKFSANLALEWSTYAGGADDDNFYSLTTDSQGNLFIVGSTMSANFPLLDPGNGAYFQGTNSGASDGTILKFSNTGVLLWGTYFGGNEFESFNSVAVNAADDILISVNTASNNFPLYQPEEDCYFQEGSANGDREQVLLQLSNTGKPIWSTYIQGVGFALIYTGTLHVAPTGEIYITQCQWLRPEWMTPLCENGYFVSNYPNWVTTSICKFTANHSMVWRSYLLQSEHSVAAFPCGDANGNLFVVGSVAFTEGGIPLADPGNGAYYNPTENSSYGTFVTKFAPSESNFPNVSIEPHPMNCESPGKVEITITNACPPYTYAIDAEQATETECNTSLVSQLEPGTHTVTITSGNHTITESFEIVDLCNDLVFVPNVFTPNESGKNDLFSVVYAPEIQQVEFSIVNRWGEVVFSTTDLSVSWNGTANGRECAEGVYFWKLTFQAPDSTSQVSKSGFLQLIR